MPQMRLVMKWASRGSLPFMKMLYPRKIDEVLRQSATIRFWKSILVKMPRLPTIRVIGSHETSTSVPDLDGGASFSTTVMRQFSSVRGRPVAGGELGPRVTPLRLLVDGRVGHLAQRANRSAVDADDARRKG